MQTVIDKNDFFSYCLYKSNNCKIAESLSAKEEISTILECFY